MVTDERAEVIGTALANLLKLKPMRTHRDRFDTTFGSKTAKGLYLTVKKVITELERELEGKAND